MVRGSAGKDLFLSFLIFFIKFLLLNFHRGFKGGSLVRYFFLPIIIRNMSIPIIIVIIVEFSFFIL